MNWLDFVKATDSTAIYPEAGTGSITEFCYVALGLAGEIGEAAEVSESSDLDAVKAELLDALWYVARGQQALNAHGYEIEGVDEIEGSAAAPLLIANTTKKLLRDGLDKEKLDILSRLYRQSLTCLFQELSEVEVGPETREQEMRRFELQLDGLVQKLNSRKDRGVLHGSGDNR